MADGGVVVVVVVVATEREVAVGVCREVERLEAWRLAMLNLFELWVRRELGL